MDKLQTCIGSLRVLTGQQDFNRQVVVEKLVNDFLREDVSSTLLASLKRVGEAIDVEANKNILGEDWTQHAGLRSMVSRNAAGTKRVDVSIGQQSLGDSAS